MQGVYKSFGGVKALKNVRIQVAAGEVHALIGENGAGKSTFMKILAGAIEKDEGTIEIDGVVQKFKSPKDALKAGISVIYQELNMAPDLTVAENIFLGNYLTRRGIVDWPEMNRRATRLMEQLGKPISPKTLVKHLSLADQQIVEIARSLKNHSKIIVLDEPTAVLDKADTEILFGIMEKLKQDGVSIIYISHRLDEVLRIADKVTVLRDGEYITTRNASELSMEDLVSYMTGKPYGEMWPRRSEETNDREIALKVVNLRRGNVLNDVSFHVRKGEVLGLAGLVGSGRSEIARAIFGVDKLDSGDIYINGIKRKIKSPRQAIRYGIGLVTEDRKQLGLLLKRPIFQNITLTDLKSLSKWTWIRSKLEMSRVQALRQKLEIKTDDVRNPVNTLSGGNQQKVVLAKWLHIQPSILILDEPTRGVDVGAKSEIYHLIQQLKKEGQAILLISSELPEIMGLSDRIVVIRRGRVVGEFTREEAAKDTRLLESLSEGDGTNHEG